jgi:transposase-like protein
MTEVVDDGRRPDRLGRMRTPRSRREELLAEYERSGLSQAAFARRAGVRYPTFAHWVQERRSERGGESAPITPAAAPPRFVELRLPREPSLSPSPAVADLSVTLPDGMVVRGAEPAALAALVRALRGA